MALHAGTGGRGRPHGVDADCEGGRTATETREDGNDNDAW